jgi:hypothetical protein
MESCIDTTEMLEGKAIGTYDFASPVELVKAIDRAMHRYFGAGVLAGSTCSILAPVPRSGIDGSMGVGVKRSRSEGL